MGSCVIESIASTVNFISSHGFDNCQFCELLSEIEDEYPDLPSTQQFNGLAVATFSCDLFLAHSQDWNFSEQELPPSTTVIKHWTALEVNFRCRLNTIS